MDRIQIGEYSLPYPNGFTMARVPNKVSAITTMSGKTLADINGWKYDSTTLSWDTLLDSDLQNLLTALQSGQFEMTFTDIDGVERTIDAIMESRISTKTRHSHNGVTIWRDIQVSVSFPESYAYEE